MNKITDAISGSLLDNGFISEEDRALCKYGIEMFIICVLELGSVLLIAAVVGNFPETVIYFVGFIPIRMYAGGYHADTRLRCFIILLLSYALFSVINRNALPAAFSVAAAAAALLNLVNVWMWAPLPHENKRINEAEKSRYRKLSILFSTAGCIIAAVILCAKARNPYSQAYLLGLCTAYITMTAGKIKNIIRKGGERDEKGF